MTRRRRTPRRAGRRLLVVGGETCQDTIAGPLRALGFAVDLAPPAGAGETRRISRLASLLILDAAAARQPRWVRAAHRRAGRVPTLVVTTYRAGDPDEAAFRLRGDDYLVVPFRTAELRYRVAALLDRFAGARRAPHELVRLGDLEIDLVAATVRAGGALVPLTPREWRVLHALASPPGVPRSPEELTRLAELTATTDVAGVNLVRSIVARVRRKLAAHTGHARWLRTSPRVGYVLSAEPTTEQPATR